MSYSKCSVIPPEFKDGQHPNSVRHLKSANQWTIHIDETGNQFGSDKIRQDEKEMTGKLVALVVRQGVKLTELPKNFHATDYQNKANSKYDPNFLDNIINEILSKKQQIGILGIQYNDSLAKSSPNWWSGVSTLIRLVLRLLPFDTAKTGYGTNIKFFIEQRDYKCHINLDAFADDLLTDLKSIDPVRFGNLTLEMQFTEKDGDKYNGYVDTIAHSWGGGTLAQERRKKAKLSGYCFLNIQDTHAVERLYALVDDPKEKLDARDWYDIMVAAADEPQHSILHDYMNNIGQVVQNDLTNWRSYLNEVQSRLKYKDYKVNQLVNILTWLDENKPKKGILPKMLELQFKSAKLASTNHKGQADFSQLSDILSLGNTLLEEDAQQVAHTFLRLATAYANNFSFEQMKEILSQEIMQNKLAIGLSNYAKNLSSLGQYYCFINQPKKAIEYFTQALKCFEHLSDKEQAKKDIAQTETYLMFAYLQTNEPVGKKLQDLFKTKSWIESVETYAQNVKDKALDLVPTDKNYKFKHQIIVRMLNQGQFDSLKNSYLKHSDKWVNGEGHPWQSINFWRGVLLTEQGKKDQAQKQFDSILGNITNLTEMDKTLLWIYSVYITAIHQLGYKIDVQIVDIIYPLVKKDLEIESYDKLNELKQTKDLQKIRQLVLQCLPFNYA